MPRPLYNWHHPFFLYYKNIFNRDVFTGKSPTKKEEYPYLSTIHTVKHFFTAFVLKRCN